MNPYAPSLLVESDPQAIEAVMEGPSVTHSMVGYTTLGMIILSGGLFGVTLMSVTLIVAMVTSPLEEFWQMLFSLLTGTVIAFGFGAVFAAIAATPIVPACLGLHLWLDSTGAPWTPRSIRVFGSSTGAISGYLCVAIVGTVAGIPETLYYGLVPALFAACTVPLLLGRLARRCRLGLGRQIQQTIEDSAPVDTDHSQLT